MNQKKQPIQSKINKAILLTSTVVLLMTGMIYLTYEFFTVRENTIERMSVLAEVISNTSTAVLAFDNKEEAYEILAALRAQEHIVAAALYDEHNALFAKYPKHLTVNDFPGKIAEDGYSFSDSYLHGFQPVILGTKRIGTLYLKYDMKVLNRQFLIFGFIAVGVFMFSLLLAYLLSSKLQRRISQPIVALAKVAQSVSSQNDYSVRAVKQSDDEIGLLTDAFNQMLTRIEQQSLDLHKSEKNFRTLADNIAQLAWMTDETGWITWYNKRWFDYTGTTFEEMEGWGWKKVHHPDHVNRVVEKFSDCIQNGTIWEDTFPLRGTDGLYRWFLSRAIPIRDDRGNILQWFGTNTDISVLREVEDALRQSEEFSRTLLESSPDCVKALDLEGRLLSINPVGLKMLEIDDFLIYQGQVWSNLWSEEYHGAVSDAIETAKKGEIGHFQGLSATTKGTIKWWDVLVAPVHGAGGNVERLISVSRDITVLKELEQQKDDFIGIASHELKTPVTSIKAYTQVLQHKFQKNNDYLAAEMLTKMDGQLNKLTNLITDLLDVTRIEQGKLQFRKELFSFNDLVSDVVEEIQRTSVKHIVKQTLDHDIVINGDRDRIGQVITNFLTNAIKYSPKANEIKVSTKVIDDEKLIFSVQDYGLGLSENDRLKVFERFYRVGESGYETFPGLGLGLYISAGIIQRHDGEIWVESEKGVGSVFYFSLPLNKKNGEAGESSLNTQY